MNVIGINELERDSSEKPVSTFPHPAPAEPGKRRIGLVWAGNPRRQNDARRSLKLADLAPLRDLPGVAWYGLQVGPAAAQAAEEPWQGRIVDLSPGLHDLAATAAALAALDALVTVDTVTAHLAGALGLPALVLLPEPCRDWRWGAGGGTGPWYPALRLVRQPAKGDWAGAVRTVAEQLSDFPFSDQSAKTPR